MFTQLVLSIAVLIMAFCIGPRLFCLVKFRRTINQFKWRASHSSSVSTSYDLNGSCKLVLSKGDITKWFINGKNDAIVNAANERMLGGGGVDGAIHRAAGPELLKACREVPEVHPGVRCPTGSAKITKGFNLPVSHIIHTVGPIYKNKEESAGALASAYRSCVEVATDNHIKYVAFPAISCGVYGYPLTEAAEIALSTLQTHAVNLDEVSFYNNNNNNKAFSQLFGVGYMNPTFPDEVHFVLFGEDAWKIWLHEANQHFQIAK